MYSHVPACKKVGGCNDCRPERYDSNQWFVNVHYGLCYKCNSSFATFVAIFDANVTICCEFRNFSAMYGANLALNVIALFLQM